MLSAIGCEKFQSAPGIFSSSRSMAAISSSLFWWNTGRHFSFGLQIDEVFRVEEAGRVGAVVRAAHLADHLRHFRKRSEDDARLVHHARALGRTGAGRERAARPDCAFIQMRQEFRTDQIRRPR